MSIERDDSAKLEMDIDKCVSLIGMFSEIMNLRVKEAPKSQIYHLITTLIGFQLWGEETTLSRAYNIHGAIPIVDIIEDSKRRKITLPEAIKRFVDPRVIEVVRKGNKTFLRIGKLETSNQRRWSSEEEKIIREIISLRRHFGSQTYAMLGLSNPVFLKDSISWLEKKAIYNLERCKKALEESKSSSEINKGLRDCAKLLKSALDKIEAYGKICPQIKECLEEKGIDLPIELSFPDPESLERSFCLKREEISELRHIFFHKLEIGNPDHDRSHVGDIAKLGEMDIANFFEYVELALSEDEVSALEEYLEIQANEASSKFDKNIFKLLLAMIQNVRYCNE